MAKSFLVCMAEREGDGEGEVVGEGEREGEMLGALKAVRRGGGNGAERLLSSVFIHHFFVSVTILSPLYPLLWIPDLNSEVQFCFAAKTPVQLKSGDEIVFGGSTRKYVVVMNSSSSNPDKQTGKLRCLSTRAIVHQTRAQTRSLTSVHLPVNTTTHRKTCSSF